MPSVQVRFFASSAFEMRSAIAKVPRRLDAHMSEQELDLLELSACLVAQSGTGTAEIVRRNAMQATFRGRRLYDAPYDFWTETAGRDPAGLIDRANNRAGRKASSGQPVVDRKLDPGWNWHRSNVTTFANKIGDDPVLFSLLEVFDGEPRYQGMRLYQILEAHAVSTVSAY